MTVNRIYLSEEVWVSGYTHILLTPPVSAIPWPPEYKDLTVYQDIRWPLPSNRCYEIAELDITYVFLRASAFQRDVAQEGETPKETP